MRIRLMLLAASLGLGLIGHARAASIDCLQQAETGVQPNVWQMVGRYFRSLSPTDPASRSRSRLLQLRAAVIQYESAKQQLIEILEAHINGQASGAVASQRLQLESIPHVLAQIEDITARLRSISDEQDLFVTEKPFKDLVMTFDQKRVTTLCDLKDLVSAPAIDMTKASAILKELKDELAAISAADDALGDYMKKSMKI
jgi:hypothetical protein